MGQRKLLIPWLSISCILLGILLSFDAVFAWDIQIEKKLVPILCIAGVVLFLVCGLRGRYAVTGTVAALAGVGIFALLERKRLGDDFLALVYSVNQRMAEYNDTVLFSFEGAKGNLNDNLLLGIIGIGLALFLAFFWFRLHGRWYGSLPVLVTFCMGMAVGKTPDKTAVLFLLLGMGTAFAWISYQQQGGRRLFSLKKTQKWRDVRAYGMLSIILAAGIAAAWYCSQQTEEELLKEAPEYLKQQHKLEREVKQSAEEIMQYVRAQFGTDSDGSLTNAKPYYEREQILEITTSVRPEKALYLRGFTGGEYRNGKWKACDTKALKKVLPTDEKIESVFDAGYLFYDFNGYTEEKKKCQLYIRHVAKGKNSKYAYLPYTTNISSVYNDDTEDCIRLDGENGIRKRENEFYVTYYNIDSDALQELVEHDRTYYGTETDRVGEAYSELSDEELEAYVDYVKETYCALPETRLGRLKELAESYWSEYGRNGTIDVLWRAGVVRDNLEKQAEYSLNLETVPMGQDYAEYFLFTQKKGFCEHFATAGTLLLRASGVPARYVSGYKVTPDQFQENENGTYTARVLDSDAHAWTEVFESYCGWVPEEMTPGESDTYRRADTQREEAATTQAPLANDTSYQENLETTKQPKQTAAPTQEPTNVPDAVKQDTQGREVSVQTDSADWSVVPAVFLFLLAVFLCDGFYWRYRYWVYQKKLLLAGGDRNQKVRIRTRLFWHFLKKSGIPKTAKAGETACFLYLAKEYPKLGIENWHRLKEVIQEAEFSNEMVSRETYDFFLDTMQRAEKLIWEEKRGCRRWYLQRSMRWEKKVRKKARKNKEKTRKK